MPPGEWKVVLPDRTAKSTSTSRTLDFIGRRVASRGEEDAPQIAMQASESVYALATDVVEDITADGKVLYFSAYLSENIDSNEEGRDVAGSVIRGENTTLRAVIRFPSGHKVNLRLRDNGRENIRDASAGDGIFSGKIRISAEGLYRIKFKLKSNHGGGKVKLSARSTTDVAPTRMRLASESVMATQGNVLDEELESSRYGLPLRFRVVRGEMPEIVYTRAELWAYDVNGVAAAIGWIGGMVQPVTFRGERWDIPFTFHEGWLSQDRYTGNITMRNIEISDLDTGDQLVVNSEQVVAVNGIAIQSRKGRVAAAASQGTLPTPEMLHGVHPSLLANRTTSRLQTRTRWTRDLLFLRGWCTNKALPTDQFSSTIRNKALTDISVPRGQSAQNRAVAVMQYLGYQPGRLRGIVAHSQGGLVAATLLNDFSYVFADNASSRSPNVVTIGSPFNGTRVGDASNSVTRELSRLFGSGSTCYVPHDIRKSKNSNWQRTIGWRAKYQISAFFTTHTRSRWYDPRDCGSLSWYIRDHDDGVLNFGEGRGFADGGEHAVKFTGHCHSDGPQTYQLRYGPFVDRVNNLFHSDAEPWQPF